MPQKRYSYPIKIKIALAKNIQLVWQVHCITIHHSCQEKNQAARNFTQTAYYYESNRFAASHFKSKLIQQRKTLSVLLFRRTVAT